MESISLKRLIRRRRAVPVGISVAHEDITFIEEEGSDMRKTRSVVLFVMLLAVVVPSHGDMGTKGFSIQYLDQGWSPELRRQFYHTAQGTELIPYDWFV